ncbi:mediator of RNA polymerase II transcription subunit 15a-like [Prunus yedoensis var. nudiflora]|uniref:Mediator of RNA polymerase II transcription subunit 15a-like n=1 Tax=Prunus yedoensis var. nudiflora TaxID=2094558 RepID=A0A314ZK48_PRUYE|nr:mediator of RNA polymerase II transcription subunit 15a-like [Prunus yedoensis var. nudiflora]
MQQNNMTSLQQMSSSSGVSTAQQNMMYLLHPSSNMDPGQGNALNSLQQVALGSVPQTPVSVSQQANMNALSSQSGVELVQYRSTGQSQLQVEVKPRRLVKFSMPTAQLICAACGVRSLPVLMPNDA